LSGVEPAAVSNQLGVEPAARREHLVAGIGMLLQRRSDDFANRLGLEESGEPPCGVLIIGSKNPTGSLPRDINGLREG
jgi:hypothetical protein